MPLGGLGAWLDGVVDQDRNLLSLLSLQKGNKCGHQRNHKPPVEVKKYSLSVSGTFFRIMAILLIAAPPEGNVSTDCGKGYYTNPAYTTTKAAE